MSASPLETANAVDATEVMDLRVIVSGSKEEVQKDEKYGRWQQGKWPGCDFVCSWQQKECSQSGEETRCFSGYGAIGGLVYQNADIDRTKRKAKRDRAHDNALLVANTVTCTQ